MLVVGSTLVIFLNYGCCHRVSTSGNTTSRNRHPSWEMLVVHIAMTNTVFGLQETYMKLSHCDLNMTCFRNHD